MTLKEKLNQLAEALIDSAPSVETTKEQVEIFKATSTWYLGLRKSEKGEELMVPYGDLTEESKDLDRQTVLAVYRAINSLAVSNG